MSDLISREDAIDEIEREYDADMEDIYWSGVNAGLKTASAKIKCMPSAQPTGELISRQDAIDALRDYCKQYNAYPIALFDAEGVLMRLPSAQQEQEPTWEQVKDYCFKRCLAIVDHGMLGKYISVPQKQGHWIKVGYGTWRCSECKEINCCSGNFCPDCGARMEVQE